MFTETRNAIHKLISNQLKPDIRLGDLYFLLGDLTWISGGIHSAITFNQKARSIASEVYKIEDIRVRKKTSEDIENLDIDKTKAENSRKIRSLLATIFNEGLFKLYLWELEFSKKTFQEVLEIHQEFVNSDLRNDLDINSWYHFVVGSWYHLALINIHFGDEAEAQMLIDQAYVEIESLQKKSWRRGYGPIILGEVSLRLGDLEKALEMYQSVFQYSYESDNPLLFGNASNGLAMYYREVQDYEKSLLCHKQAETHLSYIGAKCHLAEAYYQFGLTYQALENFEKSEDNFNCAIQIFSEVDAPKQIERVKKAISI
jgi:tetratricopeptide (TPR) repeat protein